jgi:hypothetical protein
LNAPKPRPVLDPSPADWLTARVEGFALGVKSLIPDWFESYGRLLHPVHGLIGADQLDRLISSGELAAVESRMRDELPLRWAEIAERTGRRIHPRVQFDSLIGAPRDAKRDYEAEIGTLDPGLYAALGDLLEAHTSTPGHCWFCLWDGYGQLEGGAAVARLYVEGAEPASQDPEPPEFASEVMSGPRVSIPGREYFLLEGRLQGWEHFFDQGWASPEIIWPDDRAWCVATEIDLDSTYVGGSKEMVESLLADDRFEALPASADDPIDTTGDTVNGRVVSQD